MECGDGEFMGVFDGEKKDEVEGSNRNKCLETEK